MLVDNAIVIIENIYRYMQQGASRVEVAKQATSEVAYPVIGSILTTLDEIRKRIAGIPGGKITVEKAALFGLTTDAIGFALKTAYNGLDVSTFSESNEDFDIKVQLPEANRRFTDVLREMMIPVPSGEMVPLSTLATVEYSGTVGDIVRIDNRRVVTVKANVDETKIPGPVARAQAEEHLNKFPLPRGYDVKFTGQLDE